MTLLNKIEGSIKRIEVKDSVFNAIGGGDNLITSSAILSAVSGSVSLGAQTLFLASSSKLRTDTIILEIDDKICIGQFHRSLLVENEYVICVVRHIEKNIYEAYSILSPKSGILYMQVGMGAAVAPLKRATKKNIHWLYGVSTISTLFIVIYGRGLDLEFLYLLIPVFILFYFILFYLFQWAIKPVIELSKLSEEIFEKYGFLNSDSIYLMKAPYFDKRDRRSLESVYEYRRVIQDDPYPENYVESKTKK